MDRPKAIENFTRIVGIIQTTNPDPIHQLPKLIDQMVEDVKVIQATNKKPACLECRAARLCNRNLAVPIITNCEVCNKEIVFVVPVEYQDASRWDRPVSRISDACPRAVQKKFFAWCPKCRKYPDRIEKINKFKESLKDTKP